MSKKSKEAVELYNEVKKDVIKGSLRNNDEKKVINFVVWMIFCIYRFLFCFLLFQG